MEKVLKNTNKCRWTFWVLKKGQKKAFFSTFFSTFDPLNPYSLKKECNTEFVAKFFENVPNWFEIHVFFGVPPLLAPYIKYVKYWHWFQKAWGVWIMWSRHALCVSALNSWWDPPGNLLISQGGCMGDVWAGHKAFSCSLTHLPTPLPCQLTYHLV